MTSKKLNSKNQTDNCVMGHHAASLPASLFVLLLVLLISSTAWGVPVIIPTPQPATNDLACVGTRNGGTMGCTAKEFTVGTSFSAAPGTPPFCIAGQTFAFQVELALNGSNANRYDMAFYTGQTGNDPQVNDATKLCSVATFPTSPNPYNNYDGNACGDYVAAGDSIIIINQIVSLCQADVSGFLTIPYTLTYFPNSSGVCTGPVDVQVPPTSKCQSATASVNGTVSVYSGAYVDVTKQTLPDGDSQSFSFTATGPVGSKVIALTGAVLTPTTATGGTYTPATAALATNTTTVTLTDGQTARFYINALATNQTLTITEAAYTTNWETTAAISCAAVAGAPTLTTTPASRRIDATLNTTNSAAACTVTNTKRPHVTKAFSPAIIAPGGTSDLSFTIYNDSTAAKTFTLRDNTTNAPAAWPVGMTVVAPIPKSKTCTGGTLVNGNNTAALTAANSINGFQYLTGSVAANSTCSLVLSVTVPSAGTYNNTASGLVYATGPGPDSNTATLIVAYPPTVTKSFAVGSLASGGNTNLTLTIGNTNSGAISLLSQFTDTLPAGMTIATAGNSGTCSGVTATAGANSFSIANGTSIPAGGCTVIVNITSSTAGAATNNIAIGALQTSAGNNAVAASATINIYAPPTVTKSFVPASIAVGGTSTMTITVTNPSGNPGNLTGVSISDSYTGTLLNNAAGSVVCSGAGSAALTGGVNGGATVGFSAGTIVPAGTCTITQSVTATAAVSNSTSTPAATGPVSLTGTPAGPVTLTLFQALQVTKIPNVFTTTPGSIINYIIGYSNPNASSWFQNVVITDPVPTYTTFQSAACGALPASITSCTITAPAVGGTGTVTWTLGGNLDAGSSGTVTLSVTVD